MKEKDGSTRNRLVRDTSPHREVTEVTEKPMKITVYLRDRGQEAEYVIPPLTEGHRALRRTHLGTLMSLEGLRTLQTHVATNA